MKKVKNIVTLAGILAALGASATAQTNVYNVTNVVTVLVTNVVTVTNVVAAAPVAAPVAEAASAPKASVKNPWESSVSSGLTLTRGNSQTMLFSADYLTAKKTPLNEYSLGLAAAYGNQNDQDTVNNYKAFGQWNHLFSERFFGYVRGDALRDIIADLDYRFSIGPGAGYYFIKAKETTLAVEAGLGEEFQKLGGKDNAFTTARLGERFEHKFSDRARLWQNVELLPQVDKLDNYVINFEIGIEASISKSFSLKTYLDDSYQNRPAAGRLKNDAKIVSGVSYKF
jgi:putative salt-induced outer membrane protein YdiY